jgi:hypothetical protein
MIEKLNAVRHAIGLACNGQAFFTNTCNRQVFFIFVTGCYGVREVTEEVAGVFFLFMMMEKVEWSKIITQTEPL